MPVPVPMLVPVPVPVVLVRVRVRALVLVLLLLLLLLLVGGACARGGKASRHPSRREATSAAVAWLHSSEAPSR